MNEVRLGVIGCGGMAQNHMRAFKDVPRLKFTAAAEPFESNLKTVVDTYGVKGFKTGEELLASGLVDAVFIGTPHYFHPTYSMQAFDRDIHVLTEKPVAVTAKAAQEVNEAHARKPQLKYAAMFQLRTIPKWKRMKEIISSGTLGKIQRFHWTATDWFRTEAYYKSGGWRATWAGEGGGVLLNQCPHNLDLLYWLVGMPQRISAHISLGKYHQIEVEDEVTAYLEWANGATGVFITSTGEAPGTNYLEIVGDRGRMISNSKRHEVIQLDELGFSASEFCKNSTQRMGMPTPTGVEITCPAGGSHKEIFQNFVNAILDGEALIAPAEEGLHSVELCNAMIQSGLQHQTVNIPSDRAGYENLLQELIAKSQANKKA